MGLLSVASIYRVIKSLCAPDDYNTESRCKTLFDHPVYVLLVSKDKVWSSVTARSMSGIRVGNITYVWRSDVPSYHVYIYMCVCMCVYVFMNVCMYVCVHMSVCMCVYIYIYRVSQEECARLRESIPYVKVYRYNPKYLYPKLNGYGDNGQRNVWSSCGSTYCTFSADALHVLCACRWDWNAVNIVPACPCKVLGTLRTTTALMRVFM